MIGEALVEALAELLLWLLFQVPGGFFRWLMRADEKSLGYCISSGTLPNVLVSLAFYSLIFFFYLIFF